MNVQNLQNMLIAKSIFGITANENFTFILGGVIQGDTKSSSCEKFIMNENILKNIKNLNYA